MVSGCQKPDRIKLKDATIRICKNISLLTDEINRKGWVCTAELFGRRIYQEAMRHGIDRAPEEVINAINRCSSPPGCDKVICGREIGYFEKNKGRTRYADFRERGLFVGSGVLEAGCRTVVVGQRLKQSGMYWTVRGANSIIALRCSILSNRWEDFLEHRAAA